MTSREMCKAEDWLGGLVSGLMHPCMVSGVEAYENSGIGNEKFGSGDDVEGSGGGKSGKLRRDETQHCVPTQFAEIHAVAAIWLNVHFVPLALRSAGR